MHVVAVLDDGVDIAFDAHQSVGEFGDQIRAAFGQGVAEGDAAALQAAPFGAGGGQSALLVAVDVVQVVEVVAADRLAVYTADCLSRPWYSRRLTSRAVRGKVRM